jgi:predicted phage terminase large subunit-like protein
VKGHQLYPLNVHRRKLDFPALKKAVREQSKRHEATIVLVKDKASGASLIQELRAGHFSIIQAAPDLEGDKIVSLYAQSAKIDGGFVLFPKEAPWLAEYLKELLGFPNSKYDDDVDSTVFALAWSTMQRSGYNLTKESSDGLERVLFGGLKLNFRTV